MKKENRGGKRKGSGRKPKFEEGTTTVAFRVPKSKIQELKDLVKKWLLTINP